MRRRCMFSDVWHASQVDDNRCHEERSISPFCGPVLRVLHQERTEAINDDFPGRISASTNRC